MEVDLKRLNQVVTVARMKNLSRAAEHLHISQPALSRSIATLESSLGVRLFERGRNGMAATAIGQLFLAEAESLIRNAQNLEDNLHRYKLGEGGTASLGMIPMLASLILSPVASQIMNSRPGLNLYTSVKSYEELHKELKENHIELFFCIRNQAPRSDRFAIETVHTLNGALYVRAEHPLASKENVQPEDGLAFPVLSGSRIPRNLKLSDQQGEFICSNAHILREVALNTDGMLWASVGFVREAENSGALVRLKLFGEANLFSSEVVMVRHKDLELLPATKAVVDCIKARFVEIG